MPSTVAPRKNRNLIDIKKCNDLGSGTELALVAVARFDDASKPTDCNATAISRASCKGIGERRGVLVGAVAYNWRHAHLGESGRHPPSEAAKSREQTHQPTHDTSQLNPSWGS